MVNKSSKRSMEDTTKSDKKPEPIIQSEVSQKEDDLTFLISSHGSRFVLQNFLGYLKGFLSSIFFFQSFFRIFFFYYMMNVHFLTVNQLWDPLQS